MNQFYSSLTINTRRFADVYQVFRPRYNKEYFRRLAKNITAVEAQVEKRCKENPLLESNYSSFREVEHAAKKLIQLRDQLEKLDRKGSKAEGSANQDELQQSIESLEDALFRVVIRIPNRTSRLVPEEDRVVDTVQSDFLHRQNLFKVLSHRKLSYINNCFSKSVVGPNSHYYFGIGAKLQQCLANYFIKELESRNFILTSGMCLTKSAVVEAANHKETKHFSDDPARILEDDDRLTGLHLVEASRESLLSFIVTTEQSASNEPLRLMSNGASYTTGSAWFDSDEKNLSQYQTVHVISRTPSVENYSIAEYHAIRDIVWAIYKNLDLPSRLVHCSLGSMMPNEFDAHKVEVWLPSQYNWIPVGRISHYSDYITVRAGLKRGHIIDSMVYDSRTLVASILENKQTSNGRFLIPLILKQSMPHMTREEVVTYFGRELSSDKPHSVITNYEQRRYLVKRNYAFSHSRKVNQPSGFRAKFIKYWPLMAVAVGYYALIDLKELYVMIVPDTIKKYIYDRIYRVIRRFYWWLISSKTVHPPPDLSYDEVKQEMYEQYNTEHRKRALYEAYSLEVADPFKKTED